ncbi:MAG TPA: thioredoxin domain-containing protein [Gammaproteobacteria bacterium]|jgi:protein-disulfide isomerase|nr:thioredoxin domain-containing protein [Gammaproteobacteria bacterium]
MQQKHQQHGHEREHVHVHAQHYEKDEGGSRLWLVGGIALLIVALVYSGVLLMHSRTKAASGSNLDLVQIPFDTGHDEKGMAVGDRNAPVVVREFADFQCPACGGFEPVIQQMRKEYVDTGKVRFVFFDMPLEEQHHNAMMAAQVARCAGYQDQYWQMHDLLYAKQAEWADSKNAVDTFLGYTDSLGLDHGKILSCIRTGSTHQAVVLSQGYGEALGLHATPTFAVNSQGHIGGATYTDLKALIDAQLAAGAKQ